jgi:hypothetical protein
MRKMGEEKKSEIRNPDLMETDPHKVYKTTVGFMQHDQSNLVVVVLHLYPGGREIDFSIPLNDFSVRRQSLHESRKMIQRSWRSTETLGNLSRLRPSKTVFLLLTQLTQKDK